MCIYLCFVRNCILLANTQTIIEVILYSYNNTAMTQYFMTHYSAMNLISSKQIMVMFRHFKQRLNANFKLLSL